MTEKKYKICSKCKQEKSLCDFDKDTTSDPKSNYSLSKKDTKAPVDKFDALFDDEEDDGLPF